MAGRGVVAGAAWSSRETERRRSVGTEWKRQKALPTFRHGDTEAYEQTGVVGVCCGDDKEFCLRHRVSTGQEDAY